MGMQPVFRLFVVAVALLGPVMANTPTGFGRHTTGGGNVAAVRPTTLAELKTMLCDRYSRGNCADDTPRVIELDRTFDFRGTMGSTTEWGCLNRDCGSNPGYGIDKLDYCNGRPRLWVTYDNAGPTQQLVVGFNKTLRGVGTRGIIRGTGISIKRVSNVIIQNIAVTDINHGIVWGGDAITVYGSSNVWIDHNYIARIGRQMLVSSNSPATFVTISNNHFDGTSTSSSYCDGNHYWNVLFNGGGDSITFVGNYLNNMSGRSPQMRAGVYHISNNYFRNVVRLGGIIAESGANVLSEGNYFDSVVNPHVQNVGNVYAAFWNASGCSAFIGRACVSNDQRNSGTSYRPVDNAALSAFQSRTSYVVRPMSANLVPTSVMNNAGVGKI